MEGVSETVFTDILEGTPKRKGIAELFKFTITKEKAIKDNMGLAMSRRPSFMRVEPGTYIILHMDGYGTMMSDTPMEKRTNDEFNIKANGKVLIGGLGIGLLLHNLRPKVECGVVTEIVIIEKYQEVIDLVSPYYKDLPITYICKDIFEYKPAKDEIYDTIYFDIWETICTTNLVEMSFLHRRWGRKLNKENPNRFIDSWLKYWLRGEKRKYG